MHKEKPGFSDPCVYMINSSILVSEKCISFMHVPVMYIVHTSYTASFFLFNLRKLKPLWLSVVL